jgi:hypothetical protein
VTVAVKNTVIMSINAPGDCRCVDVFKWPDDSFGFQEFRRDPEDNRGWFPVGVAPTQRFATVAIALLHAKERVRWLPDEATTPSQ